MPIRNDTNESTINQGEFHMQETNRMHGRRSYDVASFFPQVDRIELEFLALEQILSQMTCYIEMIGKEVDHRPKE